MIKSNWRQAFQGGIFCRPRALSFAANGSVRIDLRVPPTTYSTWLPLLDRFAAGDDSVLPPLQAGSIEWTNIVAERFLRHVTDALKKRLEALTAGLQKRLTRSASQVDVRGALSWAQQQLVPLGTYCKLPAFEDRVKEHLNDECKKWVDRTQSSLETSAKVGGDTAAHQVLKSGGLHWPPQPPLMADPEEGKKEEESSLSRPSPGRRVLL